MVARGSQTAASITRLVCARRLAGCSLTHRATGFCRRLVAVVLVVLLVLVVVADRVPCLLDLVVRLIELRLLHLLRRLLLSLLVLGLLAS